MVDRTGTGKVSGPGILAFSLLRIVSIASAILCAQPAQAAEQIFLDKFISLGTSSSSGTFYPIGSKICAQVNQDRSRSLVRCVAYRTVGSGYNAKAVEYGELTMGMTSPDIAYAEFSNKDDDDAHGDALRAVMSLHSTPVLMIARRAANITDTSQLAGHSINIGNRGSGQRAIVELLLKNLGLTSTNFTTVTELHTTQMGEAFCQGKVDIIVETLGNPAAFYKRMIEECNGRIVVIPPALIDKLIAAKPSMTRLMIPGGLYAGHPDPIASVGYRALLVTSRAVSEEAIRRFVSSVMDHLDDLKKSDPVLQELDPQKMFTEGVTIPLHAGVIKYLNNRKSGSSYVDSK